MINKIFDSQFLWIIVLLGFITSCEQEDNLVGYNIVGDNAAHFQKTYVGLSTENILADTLRSDRKLQVNGTIGAFSDPLFGTTKSAFYSQVRLGTLNPQFGQDAKVDSVVLSIPVYAISSDSVDYQRKLYKTQYTLDHKDGKCTIKDTLTQYMKTVKYKMDSVYGNRDATMTLKVHRVIENMGSIDSTYFSNRNFETGELFGSKTIDDKVVRNTIIQYNSNSKKDSTVVSQDVSPVIKFNLEGMRALVQEEIVNKKGSANLSDQISFITNVLKGIKIDVAENDGFIFNIVPSEISLVAYISSKNPSFIDQNGNGINDDDEACAVSTVKPRVTETLNFIVGSSTVVNSNKFYNVTQNAIQNFGGSMQSGTGNQSVAYLKGMGGAKLILALNPTQIEEIRDNIRNKGWVINEAHIKVFPASNAQGGLPLPRYLHLYNHSQNTVISDYQSAIASIDFPKQQGFPYAQISIPYDKEKGYYLLRCTEFIKNIVENNEPIDDLMLEMGNFIGMGPNDVFFKPSSPFYSDRLYNPYRLAITGANPVSNNADKKLQLEIYYSIKN